MVEAAFEMSRYYIEGECVIDTTTGLVWERFSYGQTRHAGPETVSVYDAVAYMKQNKGSGWRIPTIEELSTILDADAPDGERANAKIDASFFPGTAAGRYWTSSAGGEPEAARSFIQVYMVDFLFGSVMLAPVHETAYLRLVRTLEG